MSHFTRSLDPVTMPTDRGIFDPPLALGRIQAEGALRRLRYPDGHVGWLVTGYDLARKILADPRFSKQPWRMPVGEASRGAECRDPAVVKELRNHPPRAFLPALDPPDHTRMRRRLAGHFTMRRVNIFNKKIEDIISARLDVVEESNPPVDLVRTFSLPLSLLGILSFLDAGENERDALMQEMMRHFNCKSGNDEGNDEKVKLYDNFSKRLIQQKRKQPSNDLVSGLIDDGELADDQIIDVITLLFHAGHHTTANMLTLGIFALLDDRGRWEALSVDPGLVRGAVEELLRFVTLLQIGAHPRTALEDIPMDGEIIKSGDTVTVSLAAANRDPGIFINPDDLDLSRDAGNHLSFGHGIHQCIGQHLARLEMQLAIVGLVQRFPKLRLAVPAEEVPMLSGDLAAYGVHQLPVVW